MASVRVKICGITNQRDAQDAARLGADALGFNFYSRSPRYLPPERAADIIKDLPPFVEPIALFVQELFEHMAAACQRLSSVRTIQYHGERLSPPPASPYRFIPAFGIKDEASIRHITQFLDRCRENGVLPAAILLDGSVIGLHGGTGQTAPWSLLADFQPGVPVILAGGLTPENVAEALRIVRPFGVDVASGVEKLPGEKSLAKMQSLIEHVHEAAAKW